MPRATSKAIEALALAWRRAKTSWRALVMATLIATVLAALIASEQWLESVRGYWIGHPMLAALTASAVTLAVTVLIVDALVRSRETRRWEVVAQAAYRELSTDAFEFYAALLHRMGLEGEEMRIGEEQPIVS